MGDRERERAPVFWFVMYNSYGFRLPGNACVSVSARYTHTERVKGVGGVEGCGRVLNNPQTKMRCYSPFFVVFFPASSSVGQAVCGRGRV